MNRVFFYYALDTEMSYLKKVSKGEVSRRARLPKELRYGKIDQEGGMGKREDLSHSSFQ
jgi:hypothetical protein